MNTQPVEKVCTTCGRNVADLPRTKDSSGRYFCNPCWAKRMAQAGTSAKVVAPAGPAPDEYDLAALPTNSGRPDLFSCDDCRGTFRTTDVTFDDGEIVCRKCLAERPPKLQPISPMMPATPAVAKPPAVTPVPPRVKTQLLCFGISTVIVVLCTAAVLPVFSDPKSSESARLTAAVVGGPIGAMFMWTAVEALRGRASIHHKLTLPVAVIIGCITFRTILDNADKSSGSRSYSPDAADQARREERVAAFDRTHEKAEAMRRNGMNGTDEDLARVYDRVKTVTGP